MLALLKSLELCHKVKRLLGNRAEMTVEGEIDKEICIVNASLCACWL